MLKKFIGDHAAALKFGREFCNTHGVRVYLLNVYLPEQQNFADIVATSIDAMLFPASCDADCTPWGGWHFRMTSCPFDKRQAALALAESPALDGDLEKLCDLFLCHTVGFNREAILQMATAMQQHKTCVWHEVSRYAGSLATCPCGGCQPKDKRGAWQ